MKYLLLALSFLGGWLVSPEPQLSVGGASDSATPTEIISDFDRQFSDPAIKVFLETSLPKIVEYGKGEERLDVAERFDNYFEDFSAFNNKGPLRTYLLTP